MPARPSRCAVCNGQAYRNKYGKMMLHTRYQQGEMVGDKPYPVVCEGSDAGARP